jgi:DNA invertase Pin-like site-specific DNA recombinase
MTTEQKIIRAKVGLLELANVSQACKMMGYSRDSSGGTMERPALKRLIADIEAGQIDVIVVYKATGCFVGLFARVLARANLVFPD